VVARGEFVYGQHCLICHGAGAISGGSIPDLRRMSAATHAEFEAIVVGGSRADRGMVSFKDVVSLEDSDAVHAYLVKRAHDDWPEAPPPAD
jgi:quinohemoprotein ethanol dehydrogenase